MRKSRKAVAWTLFALCFYLAAEAFVPPTWQPTARVSVALIHGYQATGSPMMEAGGVRCRYTPTCSHYAEDAISHYGFLNGGLRAAGRLWRCSPWGGCGYDPAVETHAAAYLAPQEQQHQETADEKRAREQAEKAAKEIGVAAGLCGAYCAVMALIGAFALALKIFMIIWVFKDSKARGDTNAVLWIVLLIFTNIIGFVIYLCVRPKGELFPCPNCHQKKLETLSRCPHCNNDTGAAAEPPPKA